MPGNILGIGAVENLGCDTFRGINRWMLPSLSSVTNVFMTKVFTSYSLLWALNEYNLHERFGQYKNH